MKIENFIHFGNVKQGGRVQLQKMEVKKFSGFTSKSVWRESSDTYLRQNATFCNMNTNSKKKEMLFWGG